jgi:hypothetical protein
MLEVSPGGRPGGRVLVGGGGAAGSPQGRAQLLAHPPPHPRRRDRGHHGVLPGGHPGPRARLASRAPRARAPQQGGPPRGAQPPLLRAHAARGGVAHTHRGDAVAGARVHEAKVGAWGAWGQGRGEGGGGGRVAHPRPGGALIARRTGHAAPTPPQPCPGLLLGAFSPTPKTPTPTPPHRNLMRPWLDHVSGCACCLARTKGVSECFLEVGGWGG